MTGGVTRRLPKTLFVRLVGLLAITLLATQIVGGVLFFMVMPPPPRTGVHVSEIAEALRVARSAPGAIATDMPALPDEDRLNFMEPILAAQLGVSARDVRLWDERPPFLPARPMDHSRIDPVVLGSYIAAVRVGQNWVFIRDRVADRVDILTRMSVWLMISLGCIAPVALALGARLTSPIKTFGEAADRLGRDPNAPPMRLTGPAEVLVAIKTFNEMQSRLRAYVEDRVRMVGAIAHDLRTPLTRLRLQLQILPPGPRERAEAEIERMDRMVEGALAFVKDASALPERAPLHFLALVEAVADDIDPSGSVIEIEIGPDPVVLGDESALRRLVGNLMSNAVRYGGGAQCRVLVTEAHDAVLQIDDGGPGMAVSDLERAFDPYVRLGDDDGGIGLGLSIVRSIARAHGGEATLLNRDGGGLRAEVRLPLETGGGPRARKNVAARA